MLLLLFTGGTGVHTPNKHNPNEHIWAIPFYQQLYNCLNIIVTTLVQNFMQLIEGSLEKDQAKKPIVQSSFYKYFNRDHFESLLSRIFLTQTSENVRPHSSNSTENATPF